MILAAPSYVLCMNFNITRSYTMAEAPPPNYEAAVGGYTLTGFVDFWPSCLNGEFKAKYCKLETFDILIDKANMWLRDQGTAAVFSCETIERKVYLISDLESGELEYRAKGRSAVKVKGLRLWLTKNMSAYPMKLGYKDTIAQRDIDTCDQRYAEYENFQQVVDRFNACVSDNPIEGRIITAQTVPYSITSQLWDTNCDIDPDGCSWPDTYKNHRSYTLRVFYQVGPPCYEKIGLADFVPQQTEETGMFSKKPKYTELTEVMERAFEWIRNSTGVRVTNLQTLDTRYCRLSDMGQRLNTLTSMDYKVENRCRVLFLRVAYVNMDQSAFVTPRNIAAKTFYPLRVDGKHYETSLDIQMRVYRWLKSRDVQLLCVETLNYPKNLDFGAVYTGEWYDAGSDTTDYRRYDMLQHVRVYMDYQSSNGGRPLDSSDLCDEEDEDYYEGGACVLL